MPGGRPDDDPGRERLERRSRRSAGSGTRPRPTDPRVAAALERRRAQRTAREGAGAPRPAREPRPANFRLRRLLLVAVVVVLGVAAWFLISLYQPFAGDPGARKTVRLANGSSVGDIGGALADGGIVSSGFFFQVRATIDGKRGDLKPGTYTLREGMTYADAIAALQKGPPANTINVSVPEGRSRREVDDSVSGAGLRGSYEKATRRSSGLDPREYGARGAKSLEGFLWPATYELKRGQRVSVLVDKQLAAFKQNFARVSMKKARAKNLTPFDVLTIASLIERETAVPRERKLIASVIYNRLAQDQSLGIDATVRFIFGKWDGALTQSDLNSDSPYNTRKFKGLPPGPIGSPGLASIRAAANPPTTDYLFYVADPCDTKGLHHTFHRTLAEFNAAAARYNQLRAANGGKAPKGC